MNFVKIFGKINFGKSRNIRIPIDEVKWWGESQAPRMETEIKLSNGDVIQTQTPINLLDLLIAEALEKNKIDVLKASGRISKDSIVFVNAGTLLAPIRKEQMQKDFEDLIGCKVVLLNGGQKLEGVFDPMLYIKEDGTILK